MRRAFSFPPFRCRLRSVWGPIFPASRPLNLCTREEEAYVLGKLIALLAHAKGAAVATVLVVGAAGATVASSDQGVQDTFTNVTTALNTTVSAVTRNDASCTGDNHGAEQVAIVQQRNSAGKLLRDAWGEDHKALVDLRGGGKDVDAKAVGDVIKKYDDQLRDRLDAALIKVASLTLGRQGQVRKAEASASPSGSPSTSPSPKPSCSPKPSGSAAAATPKPSGSAKPSGSGQPDQGRVAVALRTTLDADIQTIVDEAIKDMKDLVTKATDEVAKLPAAERGKPSDQPGGKPSENPGNKPSSAPGKP